jgi:hypothetical protein
MNTKKEKGLLQHHLQETRIKKILDYIISQISKKYRIKMEVEKILGYKVEKMRFEQAYLYANHKLNWQGELNKIKYGEKYTAIVTAEIYEQQILSDYMNIQNIRRLNI